MTGLITLSLDARRSGTGSAAVKRPSRIAIAGTANESAWCGLELNGSEPLIQQAELLFEAYQNV